MRTETYVEQWEKRDDAIRRRTWLRQQGFKVLTLRRVTWRRHCGEPTCRCQKFPFNEYHELTYRGVQAARGTTGSYMVVH